MCDHFLRKTTLSWTLAHVYSYRRSNQAVEWPATYTAMIDAQTEFCWLWNQNRQLGMEDDCARVKIRTDSKELPGVSSREGIFCFLSFWWLIDASKAVVVQDAFASLAESYKAIICYQPNIQVNMRSWTIIQPCGVTVDAIFSVRLRAVWPSGKFGCLNMKTTAMCSWHVVWVWCHDIARISKRAQASRSFSGTSAGVMAIRRMENVYFLRSHSSTATSLIDPCLFVHTCRKWRQEPSTLQRVALSSVRPGTNAWDPDRCPAFWSSALHLILEHAMKVATLSCSRMRPRQRPGHGTLKTLGSMQALWRQIQQIYSCIPSLNQFFRRFSAW